jgi:hypothetical protein
MNDEELDFVARVTGAERARRGERVQSLWSGYGEIVRVRLDGRARAHGDRATAIVKSVKPPARVRGQPDDASHARKRRSYDVELAWYRGLASRCDESCRVPAFLGGRAAGGEWLIVLEDLDDAGFPERRRRANATEFDVCLGWLAAFHARFLTDARVAGGAADTRVAGGPGAVTEGLWKTGTYWHLATRAHELAAMRDGELRAAAPVLDRQLRSATFQTLVHGDAKLANFCFAPGGRAVAAVDFQYVGGGPGMKDVAYLLSGESSSAAVEQRHLDTYFKRLREEVARHQPSLDAVALESEWRALYPIALADFQRFLAGWGGGG